VTSPDKRVNKPQMENMDIKAFGYLAGELPDRVQLIEVGPRDGFQQETKMIPTPLKVKLIKAIADAGVRQIQVTSFVNPSRVPQMADAELLIKSLPERPNVIFNALVLNSRGLMRALGAGVKSVEISVSASDTHSIKNTGMSRDQALSDARRMIESAKKSGCHVRAGIQCAFGCVYEGQIPQSLIAEIASGYLAQGIDMLAIADTTGMASPPLVASLLEKLSPLCAGVPLILHLHDKKGMGFHNMVAGMAAGVGHFDTGLGGLGGCPAIPDAVGNIDTIQAAHLLRRMNIETGIDISALERCAEEIRSFLKK
jgi:hydroxymethylglutaryl-CoA lyase